MTRQPGRNAAVYIGLGAGALGCMAFALAPSGWIAALVIVPWALVGLAVPAMRSIMSRAVPADAQGALQGVIASVISLAAIVTPLVMTQMFTYFTGTGAPVLFPGAPYLVAGLLLLFGLIRFAGTLRAAAPAMQAPGRAR